MEICRHSVDVVIILLLCMIDIGCSVVGCGEHSDIGLCWCDDLCETAGDCCNDYQQICGESTSLAELLQHLIIPR